MQTARQRHNFLLMGRGDRQPITELSSVWSRSRSRGAYAIEIEVQSHSLTVSQNFGICSEPRSMGNAIASWRERPISVALLQSS